MEVRGHLVRVGSLLPYGFQESSSTVCMSVSLYSCVDKCLGWAHIFAVGKSGGVNVDSMEV